MNLIYLFGPPAAGKSTLMAALTAGCARFPMSRPFAHDLLTAPLSALDVAGIELGRSRATFPGTDTLGLSVSPKAKEFMAGQPSALILGEGDRLAHAGFFDAAADAGYAVTGVYLTTPDEVLERRCAARGSHQPASWKIGRATKSARLAGYIAAHHTLVTLDGTVDPERNVAALVGEVPSLAALPSLVP